MHSTAREAEQRRPVEGEGKGEGKELLPGRSKEDIMPRTWSKVNAIWPVFAACCQCNCRLFFYFVLFKYVKHIQRALCLAFTHAHTHTYICTRARICMPSDSDTLPKANEGKPKARQGTARQGRARQKASLGNGTDGVSDCEMRSRTQDSGLRSEDSRALYPYS